MRIYKLLDYDPWNEFQNQQTIFQESVKMAGVSIPKTSVELTISST